MTRALYCTAEANGIRLATTAKVDALLRRMGRAARRARRADVLLAIVLDDAGTKKLRRVLQRHWNDQYRGGGVFSIGAAEVIRVVGALSEKYGLTCYGTDRPLSAPARGLVLRKFARGRRARHAASALVGYEASLIELLVAGAVTRHERRGVVTYRGTERAVALARRQAEDSVPGRGHVEPPVSRSPITELVVVPEPEMAREELLHQLDLHKDDPASALQPGYRGAAVNMRLLIGTLAMVSGLTKAQKDGAAHFRRVAEHAQLGGAKAIDYEVTRVDTSVVGNVVMDVGAAARSEYLSACERLGSGTHRLAVAERLIIHDESIRRVALGLGYGTSGAARRRIIELARDAATELAKQFGYMPSARRKLRVDGDQPNAFTVDPGAGVPTARASRGQKTRKC